ncbi:hypothetical protein HDU93_007562 [Gonapodya sp. JEL0774]|nr:hypothetical protein HDU93_007562 [Gonapodya sp. JEL0774]
MTLQNGRGTSLRRSSSRQEHKDRRGESRGGAGGGIRTAKGLLTESPQRQSTHTKRRRRQNAATAFDVYTYQSSNSRERQKLASKQSGQGEDDSGSLDSGDEDGRQEIIDDEEISEDDAFDSEDEKRWGQFFDRADGQSRTAVRDGAQRREDEEDQGESEDSSEEDDDLAQGTLLSDLVDDKFTKQLLPTEEDPSDEDGSADEDAHINGSDSTDENESETVSEDETKLANLDSLVTSLGTIRTRNQNARASAISEVYDENEYDVPVRREGQSRVELEDLLGALDDTAGFSKLKKNIRRLERAGRSNSRTPGGAVPTPLPHRLQERVERKAAYEESKKEVSKWTPVVKKYRESEHLDFGAVGGKLNVTSAALAGNIKPQTDLEKEVRQFLSDASLVSERKRGEFEELEAAEISMEEGVRQQLKLKVRRAELAKMRSLMFFHELKLKKAAKIKSRTYRKLKKVDAAKRQIGQEGDLDSSAFADTDSTRAQEGRLQQEIERAKERMSLRHRSKGQWAKELAKIGKNSHEGSRQAQMQALDERERLRKKILTGLRANSDSDVDESERSDSGSEDGFSNTREHGVRALAALEQELGEYDGTADRTGIMAMKFMQHGEQAEREEARKAIEKMRMDLEDGVVDDIDSGGETYESGGKVPRALSKKPPANLGRQAFGKEDDKRPLELASSALTSTAGMHNAVSFSVTTGSAIDVGEQKLFDEEPFEIHEEAVTHVFKKGVAEDPIKHAFSDSDESVSAKLRNTNSARTSVQQALLDSKAIKSESVLQRPPYQPEEANPWLLAVEDIVVSKARLSSHSNPKEAGREEKALNKVDKQKSEVLRKVNKPHHNVDAMELDADILHSLEHSTPSQLASAVPRNSPVHADNPSVASTVKQQYSTSGGANGADLRDDSDRDSDVDTQAVPSDSQFAMIHQTDLRTLSNPELMRLAFANDDAVVDEFEDEKRKEVGEAEGILEHTGSLPGWPSSIYKGSWAGAGVKEPKKRMRKDKEDHAPQKKPKTGLIPADKRKDAKLPYVIINEKKMRKVSNQLSRPQEIVVSNWRLHYFAGC